MEGANWKVTFKDVIDENENLAISMIDPRMSKADIRKVLEPHIVRQADGTEVPVEEGFEVASRALRQLGSEVTVWIWLEPNLCLLEAFLDASQTFLRVPV